MHLLLVRKRNSDKKELKVQFLFNMFVNIVNFA